MSMTARDATDATINLDAKGDGGATPFVLRRINVPDTTGGLSAYRNLDLGTTGQVVKASAGQLYGYYLANRSLAERFVKVYNKATAPTGSDTPVFTWAIPAQSSAHRTILLGVAFSAGISLRATTGVADADTGAPATNDVVVNVEYA